MRSIHRNLRYIATAVVAAALGVGVTAAFGQDVSKEKDKSHKIELKDLEKAIKAEKNKAFCSSDNWSSGDKVSYRELRESNFAASGSLAVDAGKNGGISVIGEERGDIVMRACVQTWGVSDEAARGLAASVRIATGGTIKAEGPEPSNGISWSVSYQFLVPRSTNLKLNAHNGGISIGNVDGSLEFQTLNGGLSLKNLSGDVRGRTTNGGINVTLTGNSWRGSGLDLTTTNGGIHLSMPASYAARVEAGTVNGGFSSDIPALNITQEDLRGSEWTRHRAKRIDTVLNGGGAPIKVTTTNGGVRITSQN